MNQKLNIKSWAEEDRPREKLLEKGKESLSNSELIAILIGSGNREETAVGLSKKILLSVNNDLNLLGKLTVSELMKFKGIGEAKALSIAAALELGRRRALTEPARKIQISCSKDAFVILNSYLSDLPHEEFWMLLLNRSNKIIEKVKIGSGGLHSTVVDVRIILKIAIDKLASSLVLFHNHPSGNLKPSPADIAITHKIKEAANWLDIKIIDHLIIADGHYYSFADQNKI